MRTKQTIQREGTAPGWETEPESEVLQELKEEKISKHRVITCVKRFQEIKWEKAREISVGCGIRDFDNVVKSSFR